MARIVRSEDGVPIAYESDGHGAPALVFVHGWSCDRGYWAGQLGPFARRFQVVAVDLAGHGESGPGREAQTMDAFGADVAAVVEELGLRRVVLVGHSMGGDVVVEAARRLPGRVAGLVWVDVYRQLRTPRTAKQIAASLAPFHADFVATTRAFVRSLFPAGADPLLVERVATDMSAAPPEIALEALEATKRYDGRIVRPLGELALPVVAVNAATWPTDVGSLEEHGVEVILMPGVGHFLMMEDPEGFNRLLAEAIGRLPP